MRVIQFPDKYNVAGYGKKCPIGEIGFSPITLWDLGFMSDNRECVGCTSGYFFGDTGVKILLFSEHR